MDEIVLRDLIESDPNDDGAAEALIQLLTRSERWDDLVQLFLERIEASPSSSAVLYHRLADVLEHKLGQKNDALIVLLDGLKSEGDDDILGEDIGRLAEELGEWAGAIEAYTSLVQSEGNHLDIHRRLADWHAALGHMEESFRHRRCVYDDDPHDSTNIAHLQRYLEDIQDWHAVETFLVDRFDKASGNDQYELAIQLAHLYSDKIHAPEQELQWYGHAFSLKPSQALLDVLDVRISLAEQWALFAALLTDALSAAHQDQALVLRIHTRLSEVYEKELGEPQKAAEHLFQLADQTPWNADNAAHLRRVLQDAEDWTRLTSRLEVDVAELDDESEQFECLLQLGTVYMEHLNQPEDGVDAMFRALKLRPSDKVLLVRLMDGYRLVERWPDSVTILKRLTSVETDSERRAQYFHAIGVIQRDKLNDVTAAVRAFDQALEFDPTFMRAFQAIEEVLVADSNYQRMDRYYRKMLVRALDNQLAADLIADLAERIGEINERYLNDEDEAIKAYQLALTHAPERTQLHGRLAELDARTGRLDDAINRLMDLIDENPLQSEPYHSLVSLYCRADRLDEAFCVCQTLRVFGKSTPEEDDLYESVLRRRTKKHPKPLDRATWHLLTEDLEAPEVGSILADLTPILLDSVSRSERALGIINDKERLQSDLIDLLEQTAFCLNVPAPEMRASKKVAEMSIGQRTPPVLLVGGGLPKLSVTAVRFLLSRHLFLISGQNYLATVQSDFAKRVAWLTSLLGSVHKWVDEHADVQQHSPELLNVLRTLPESEQSEYRKKLSQLLAVDGYGITLWLSSVESLACRLAFIICDDLEVAVQQIRRNHSPLSDTPANMRILDVILFAISPMYTSIRERIGMTVHLDEV